MPARRKGELRTAVLQILWRHEQPLTAREIQAEFADDTTRPAVTTLLTVLDRLRSSGHVLRQPTPSGEFAFSASEPESRYAADTMITALLNSADSQGALMRFAGELDEYHVAALRRALDDRAVADGRE